MKKMILVVMLAVSIILPSTVFAGIGATQLYCPWFNDSNGTTCFPTRYTSWVSVSNQNDSAATLQITYYDIQGNPFTNSSGNSVFEHTVPAKGSAMWRPTGSQDLNIASPSGIQGSYVITVTAGSVTASNTNSVTAGDLFHNINVYYALNDWLCSYAFPLPSAASTFLTMDAFVHYNPDQDGTLDPGENNTWFAINNPSGSTAEFKFTFYHQDGSPYLDSYSQPLTITETLAAHRTHAFTPSDYGIHDYNNGNATGHLTIDVTKGSVVACYARFYHGEGALAITPPMNILKAAGSVFTSLVTMP